MISDDLFLEPSTGGTNDPSFQQVINDTQKFTLHNLEEQLRSSKEQINRLNKNVWDKNNEIDRLLKKISKLNNEKDQILDSAGDNIAQKLINLTKKCSSLNLEMEKERTKNRILEKEINEYKIQSENAILKSEKLSIPVDQLELKNLKNELNSSNQKAAEARNECQRMRQELRLYHKALQNEIGDNFSIDVVLASLNDNSQNWKGRSQKIAILERKLAEEKVNNKGESKGAMSTESVKNLNDMAIKRRKEIENLKTETTNLNEIITKKDHEIQALKSRSANQSNEGKTLRARIKVMKEKGAHDDELVETLTKRLVSLQQTLSVVEKKSRSIKVKTTTNDTRNANKDIVEISKMKQLLGEKETIISNLKDDLLNYKNEVSLNNIEKSKTDGLDDRLEMNQLQAELNSLKSEHVSIRNLIKNWNIRLNETHPDRDDARFAELFKSKRDDLEVYETTIEETRKVFMDAMKAMKEHVKNSKVN